MTRSRLGNILISALLTLMPLLWVPARLLHPGPWLAFLGGCVVLLTQPPLGPKAMVQDRGDRLSGLLIFAGVIGSQLAGILQFGFRDAVSPKPVSVQVACGIGLVICGLAVRVVAIRTLGRFFTSTVQVQSGQRVVRSGPYRFIRHPSYTGIFLFCAGVSLALASPVAGALTLLLVLPAYLYRIRVEERTLIEGLGEEYIEYRRRTRALIPLLL